jgi:hypothetical protein
MCQVIPFDSELRAAQIAAELCHKNGYGLTTTQAFQRESVRRVRRDGLTPYMAAHLVVRGPREPFFGPTGNHAA